MNYPLYDLYINSLIKGYFTMYFNNEYIQDKYISRKKKRKSFNKIYVSKAEIKHTSSKAIITIYVYNREKIVLLKNFQKFQKLLRQLISNKKKKNGFLNQFSPDILHMLGKNGYILGKGDLKEMEKKSKNFSLQCHNLKDIFSNSRFILDLKCLSLKIAKILTIIRRFRLKLNLNKYKFEEKFLSRLSQYIGKYYGKKVEFNIVNLKSIAYNGDIFTEILTSKIKKERANPVRTMNTLLSRVKLPKVNRVTERGRIEKKLFY